MKSARQNRIARRRGRIGQGGILARLARDTRGNTLILVAAALLPLMALIGSGIDMGRGYLAQSRMQQACDAAALAGRRAMTAGVVDSTVSAEAEKFFKFNFPIGTDGQAGTAAFKAKGFKPVVGSAANSTVTVSATTTLPTTVMKIFGFQSLPLEVTCYAKQDFVNTDIVLVLDTTGSMLCATTETSCSNSTEKTSSKIKALRSAVLALYDELAPVQTQLAAAGLRLRYGIVPYSSGVNVGKVVQAVNSSYIVSDTWNYYSRAATTSTSTSMSSSTCRNSYNGTYTTNGSTGQCVYYPLLQRSLDVSNYVSTDASKNNVDVAPLIGGASKIVKWAGCIEERETVSTITATSGTAIPSGANDLNTDLVPTATKATKWAPYWPEVVFNQDTGVAPQVACPTEARRLTGWTRTDLNDYLDTLRADGGTYHDNGMIWGARFISPNGIFGANNPSTYNNFPVSRYIIFMTDGMTDTGATLYHTYGMEKWDKRVTGGYVNDTDSDNRHKQRFRMMCAAAKNIGVSIWVVAFAQALDSDLTACASSAAQASTSSTSTDLSSKFVEIGKNIGALRLTQ
ncbi:MAG: hypothetical protein JWM38_2595 [Sphingomonas bacterium]|nr:hypothetical protein [Sphingomonas bacterium]MDB5685243.1 hypothetical protein [Sphingomonas bacterium]MDB5719168.1 hypothetical protein [Sphingomonas bacterium]